jgi:pyruvate dehydrogenase E2 component (dihydrolipoamide acetyltransferase)
MTVPGPSSVVPGSGAIDVVMPQMGESVAEGTIVRWIKKVGDPVDRDEPLFEISTDKVDAEIPSPGAGVLIAIYVNEGETVPVNSLVAVIGDTNLVGTTGTAATTDSGNALAQSSSLHTRDEPRRSATPPAPAALPENPAPTFSNEDDGQRSAQHGAAASFESGVPGVLARRRTLSSPVVRRIAKEHGIEIGGLTGSGISGRVTRRDIEALVERRVTRSGPVAPPPYAPGDNVRIEKMSVMRRKIAEHMAMSVRTSPHVYSMYEVDFGHVDELRKRHKRDYDAAGAKLTYTVFIAKATADALRECPFANASIDGDNVVYKEDINLGIAVALEQGLIVPVIRSADRLTMKDLSRAVQDLADRARSKQLKVDDVQGGTFTITNPGVFGAVLGLPIISQPQVAIMAVGSIDKRAVVVDDAVVIRPMCYFTLGHDHRLIDGAEGAQFLRAVKTRLEQFDEALL